MIIQFQRILLSILTLFVIQSTTPWAQTDPQLSPDDLIVLRSVASTVQLGQQFPDSLWPGYNLNEMPFIVYVPDQWALLVNAPDSASEFTGYPEGWPSLGTHVLFHEGKLGQLAGQLAFNIEIDSAVCAAVGFLQHDYESFLGYIVHENFHQFQYAEFGDIPWAREELYPIEDVVNTSLACLEILSLADALRFLNQDDNDSLRSLTAQFIAIRLHRWQQADQFLRDYEKGKEIHEGTARYVEAKALGLIPSLNAKPEPLSAATSTADERDSFTAADHITESLDQMVSSGSVKPENMPRNRIYPVGAAQGLLLDCLGVDWKLSAQQVGPTCTFVGLLEAAMKIDSTRFDSLVKAAKQRYDYEAILKASKKLIGEYREGFVRDSADFDSQPGLRVELCLSGRNLRRSRNSSAKKWLVDDGSKELRNHFDVYILESATADDLYFCLKQAGLLELNNWTTREKTVVFHCREMSACSIDGKPQSLTEGIERRFTSLQLRGANFEINASHSGKILVTNSGVLIDLLP